MKHLFKISLLLFSLFTTNVSWAVMENNHATTPSTSATLDLSTLSAKEYGALVGKKMSLKDKIVFHFTKEELSKASKNVDKTTFDKAFSSGSSDFNLGGFLLGFFLSIFGVLIALLFGKDVLRWAWKGFWVSLLVWVIGLLI
jgi:hypothetical protein